jgi:hypothetical protein
VAAVYCAPSDLYTFGLQRGAVPNPGRVVASADATANTITLDVHGFVLNDPVAFRAEAGGSLPTPLAEGSTYYAIPLTESTFSVAAAEDGAAVDLSSAGSRFVTIVPLPVDASIAWASRVIDDMLPAHLVPLEEPIPEIVRMTAAELAAHKIMAGKGLSKTMGEMVDSARKRLERWGKGVPIRGENAPPPANKSISATVPFLDRRGWGRFGGIS